MRVTRTPTRELSKVRRDASTETSVELDLGDSGPLLVFGGPYSNLQATEALFREAKRLGVPSDRIVCTGDIVAYCGDPLATVQAIRAAGIAVVLGNCEEQLGTGADECGCGFAPGMMCHALSREWFTFAIGELDEDSRAWMRNLPRRIWLRFAGRRLAAIHGGASRINRFIFKSSPWRIKRTEVSALGAHGVLAGHCGIPFTQINADRMWHNAGVIGMPANDGHSGTWYSLLTAEAGSIRIEHRRLDYPHRAAAERMRQVGLSHHYADALISGLWPSLDILPQTERRRTGEPLTPSISEWARSPLRASRHFEPQTHNALSCNGGGKMNEHVTTLEKNEQAVRSPVLFPHLAIAERIMANPIGSLSSGFHIHSVDDTLSVLYTESEIGTFHDRPVRSIRSLPRRPICLGPKTQPGHIDHIAIDFLKDPMPAVDQFNSIAELFPDAKVLTQDHPNCCGMLVTRKLWVYLDGYPPLEVALGPLAKGEEGCDPRPAWPS